MAPTEYTAINVSHAARNELRRFQAVAGGTLARRLTMTDALMLAVRIATAHVSEGPEVWRSMSEATEPNGEAQ